MNTMKALLLGGNADSEPAVEAAVRSLETPRFQVHACAQASGPGNLEGQIASLRPDILLMFPPAEPCGPSLDMVSRVRRADFRVPLLAIIRDMEQPALLDLLEKGLTDFVILPLRPLDLLARMLRLAGRFRGQDPAVAALKEKLGMRKILGESEALMEEIRKIPRVAGCDATVLIQGETGTGKEMLARTIHYLSPRADKPFVPVNCGAIPPDLIENELFGHEREAFTGAAAAKPGLIREAQSGTLFLDEVDSLPPLAQVKVLRFLQEKEYRPLGATKAVSADVRVLAAANGDLEGAVALGKMRRDLYYRLNVITLRLPPLRDRKEDIPLLAEHFLARYAREFQKQGLEIAAPALRDLARYDWPGNIRELEHVIQRAVLLSDGGRLQLPRLPGAEAGDAKGAVSLKAAKARLISDFEKRYIQDLLARHGGNISQAAASAGKNRRAFWQLIQKYGIDAEGYRPFHPRGEAVSMGG